ncbi:MAG TPA: enolase C-terminal domain-like protein [Burkholderiales bacterium]|nr:enolase C-terminal domain-like protein [Burkholderiales bacterium]
MAEQARIERASVAAYRIPTEAPESDGTLEWSSTTLVVVRLEAGGRRALGYGYGDRATASLIHERLLPLVEGRDAHGAGAVYQDLVRSIRNLGRPGVASMAISAVDAALWDLRAKLLQCSLADLLGTVHAKMPVYGSGGFTSISIDELQRQLRDWAESGIGMVKMKVGREPGRDVERVRRAREALGDRVALFVDANGAYGRKQALGFAQQFAQSAVAWFEEPVSSDDLAGLAFVRERVPMAVSAGEYGYDLPYFRRMLEAQAVDVLQPDATRCGGIRGFLAAAALAEAHAIPVSSHTAPMLHLAPCCAAPAAVHLEYFHDHVRIERMLFEGFCEPKDGAMAPDRARPGLGIELRTSDAERFRL